MIAQGTPSGIKSALGDVSVYSVKTSYTPEMTAALEAVKGVLLTNQFGDNLHIVTHKDVAQTVLEEVMERVKKAPVHLSESEPDLEDVFIALTQGGAL